MASSSQRIQNSSLYVELISSDVIKPAFPTPNHLKTHKLSFLDQFQVPIYVPFIFFYPNVSYEKTHNNDTTVSQIDRNLSRTELLKRSLSETLAHFYPLAGRLEGNSSIDCNDQGAEYHEARVSNYTLNRVLETSNVEDLRPLLPIEPVKINHGAVLGVQVTHFSCGGTAIGVSVSHKAADGTSITSFIDAWAATARGVANGGDHFIHPKLDLGASIFPPIDLNGIYNPEVYISKEKIVTRRLSFNKEQIDFLKKQATMDNGSHVQNPTRVEVVTAFIWKSFIDATKAKVNLKPAKMFGCVHAVNLRSRMEDSVPKDCFGNMAWFTVAATLIDEKEASCSELISKLRDSIKRVNDENFIKNLQNGECLKELKHGYKDIEKFNFTSFTRFPVYDVDFGWGKPSWVTSTFPFKNLVVVFNTKCGEGIEALVNMIPDDVFLFENYLLPLSRKIMMSETRGSNVDE